MTRPSLIVTLAAACLLLIVLVLPAILATRVKQSSDESRPRGRCLEAGE